MPSRGGTRWSPIESGRHTGVCLLLSLPLRYLVILTSKSFLPDLTSSFSGLVFWSAYFRGQALAGLRHPFAPAGDLFGRDAVIDDDHGRAGRWLPRL